MSHPLDLKVSIRDKYDGQPSVLYVNEEYFVNVQVNKRATDLYFLNAQ